MSHMPEPRELDPEAAGLIRASLTRDKFATDRILTRAFEGDVDGLLFAFTVANLAGRILAQACGSEAQAAALVDGWINGLVKARVRAAALQLDVGLDGRFGLWSGIGLQLGFAFDPGGVFAAGLPLSFLCCEVVCGLVYSR
jgi:hypothetical protein